MEEEEILDQEIDRYIAGGMDATEKAAFEKRMAGDEHLKKEVKLHGSIIKGVRMEQLERIIKDKEKSISKRGKIRRMIITYGSLAAAACVAGIFYTGYLNNCEKIANRYCSSYAYMELPSRGEETSTMTKADSVFLNALDHLNVRIEKDGNIGLEEKDKEEWNVSHKELKNAIRILESLNEKPGDMIVGDDQAIKWYLSLAYLKNGQKKMAKALLQEIAGNKTSDYQSKARDLMKEL